MGILDISDECQEMSVKHGNRSTGITLCGSQPANRLFRSMA
jgi:hypothetical protein